MAQPARQLPLFEIVPPVARPLVLRPDEVRARARQLANQIAALLGNEVRLAITDNRSTVISFQRRPGALALRLHHMFLQAPESVVRALAAYAGKGQRSAGPLLDEFIGRHRDHLRPPRRGRPLRTRGLFYDLREIYERVNRAHFGGSIDARICWGRLPRSRGRRSIRMGVYLHDERVIRIHPALDRPEVPLYFVEFVVFHEMLHQAVPAERCSGRCKHHGKEFLTREKTHPDHTRAVAWERAHLDLLLGRQQPGVAYA